MAHTAVSHPIFFSSLASLATNLEPSLFWFVGSACQGPSLLAETPLPYLWQFPRRLPAWALDWNLGNSPRGTLHLDRTDSPPHYRHRHLLNFNDDICLSPNTGLLLSWGWLIKKFSFLAKLLWAGNFGGVVSRGEGARVNSLHWTSHRQATRLLGTLGTLRLGSTSHSSGFCATTTELVTVSIHWRERRHGEERRCRSRQLLCLLYLTFRTSSVQIMGWPNLLSFANPGI